MKAETKQRIEQIRRGEVPEGYKQVGQNIVPKTWNRLSFVQVAIVRSGLVSPKTEPYSSMLHVGPENIEKDTGKIENVRSVSELGLISGKFYFDSSSIVYSKIRPSLNKVCVPDFEGICSADCYSIKTRDNVDKNYLFTLMLSHQFCKRAVACSMRTGIPKINQDDLNAICLVFPDNLEEQHKIAAILTAQDKVIELKERLLAEKQRQKAYLMQQLLTGKKRLPGFSGAWKNIKLCEVVSERKEKNVEQNLRICSVAVQKGVVDQVEHLGRSYAANDTSNYSVVHYGDIVYTKSPTGNFLYGIVKQNLLQETVAVSPLYGVFTPLTFGLGYLLHTYFQSAICARNYLLPIVQKGAKNTINITNDTFISSKLYLPLDVEEQKAIADTFIAADREIELLQQDIGQEKQRKKALMHLLLTGIVRVTP